VTDESSWYGQRFNATDHPVIRLPINPYVNEIRITVEHGSECNNPFELVIEDPTRNKELTLKIFHDDDGNRFLEVTTNKESG
jgi:hypothetical protein